MNRNFYVIEFTTAEGVQISRTFATIRKARKELSWYSAQSWVTSARLMRGGVGCMEAV